MSFFSKLFGGDKEAEKTARELFKGLFGENAKKDDKPEQNDTDNADTADNAAADAPVNNVTSSGPSGDSWGEDMPEEDNQYKHEGAFWLYFEGIFNTEFAQYRYEKEVLVPFKRIVYTFYSGDAKVLALELMSESCSAKKFRNDCNKTGVPYVRFYHDHDGWWNTRSYVVRRMKEAIG